MPMAVSYLRFSSAPQQYGDSYRRQQEAVGRWLQQNPDFTLSDVRYEDLGVSGFTGEHRDEGALGDLLGAVETGKIPRGAVVLVEALDRLSRLPPVDTLTLLNKIVTAGVDLVTLEDSQRYDANSLTDSRLFMLAAKAQAANEYSARLSTRIASSYVGRAEKAKLGQKIKRRNPFWLTSEGALKPDETEVVRDLFTRYVQGEGIRSLFRRYPGHFANPSSVRKLLTNQAAIGHWQRYDSKRQPTDLIRNVFEPAIDEVLFYQAQKMMKQQPELTHPRTNPLAGLVICAECGGNFARRNANTRSQTETMGCYTRMLNTLNCSNSKNLPMPVLGHVFWVTMRGHVYQAIQKARLSDVEKQRIVLEAQIDETQTQQRKLLAMLASFGDDTVLTERYAALRGEITALQAQLAALPADSESVPVSIIDLYATINADPIALTKALQLGGYRIKCDSEGRMDVAGDVYTYTGYNRKSKTFWIKDPDGNFTHPDER